MKFILNRLLGRLEKWNSRNRLRIIKTIYVNFRLLPFRQAIKFPIYIYGKTKLCCLNGNVEFVGVPVSHGIVKLGKLNNQYSNVNFSSFLLSNHSVIQFRGRFIAANGYLLHLKDNARLILGDCVSLGDNVSIICSKRIEIGNYTQITFNNYIVDSNFHYTIDLAEKKINRREGCIIIGDRNWVGNGCYISKGTVTGDGCVIGAGSYVNKSFNIDNSLILGRPAAIKMNDYTRVLSFEREMEIESLFQETDKDIIEYNKYYYDPYQDVCQFFD